MAALGRSILKKFLLLVLLLDRVQESLRVSLPLPLLFRKDAHVKSSAGVVRGKAKGVGMNWIVSLVVRCLFRFHLPRLTESRLTDLPGRTNESSFNKQRFELIRFQSYTFE